VRMLCSTWSRLRRNCFRMASMSTIRPVAEVSAFFYLAPSAVAHGSIAGMLCMPLN
jgi:hypothetical protein